MIGFSELLLVGIIALLALDARDVRSCVRCWRNMRVWMDKSKSELDATINELLTEK